MNQRGDDKSILKVSGLKPYFFTSEGVIRGVAGVDFEVKKG
jgi:ABC-type dipeptide/oligopeptide/nickel transport system ATPase component